MQKIRFINMVRVLGLFLVLTYHFFSNILPGGFLGVDVFFTFSGYLITALMMVTLENKKKFDFIHYIKRRFLRIFPALFFSIFFTLPFVNLLSGDFSANINKQIAAALSFVTNYFEMILGGNYEAKLIPHLYIHTWSLALEMHYYLFWGILLSCLLFIMSRLKNYKLQKVKIILIISAIVLIIFSYLHMQSLVSEGANKSIPYFSTISHIYPFLLGSILGVCFGINISSKMSIWLKKHSKFFYTSSKVLILLVSFSILLICFKTNFENEFTYKYGFFIVSILTVILIGSLRVLHEIVSKSKSENKLIEHIANISYHMYLFHWPLFIVFSNILKYKLLAAIVTTAFSYLFSILMFYNLEPIFYKASYVKRKSFSKARKNINLLKVAVLSLICLFFNAKLLNNKQDISKLEEEQMIGNIVQNIDKIKDVKNGLDKLNENPFLQTEGIKNFDKLDAMSNEEQDVKNTQNENANSSTNKKSGITIVGDSVALGARKKLIEKLPGAQVNTEGNRSLEDGYNLIKSLQKNNALGECIVVALGTNGCNNWQSYIDKFIAELPSGYRLVFVTPYDGRWTNTWMSYKTTQYLREIKNKYSFVTIVDWADKISTCPELLGSDKTHIGGNEKAINVFSDMIIGGINEALSKNAKP